MQGAPRIDELRQKFHENPRRYFAPLANEYRKAGDPEQAIAICRAHLAQQPGHMSGHVVYGQALYDARRTDEARTVFEKAHSLDPDNAIVLRHLGDIARERGDTTEARHWYTSALDADPQDSELAAYIAELTEPLTGSGADSPGTEPVSAAEPAAPDVEKVPDGAEPVRDDSPTAVGEWGEEAVTPAENAEVPWRNTPPFEQSPFVTRTMAELYAKQGYRDAALDVFRQLAIAHPDDQDIRGRIEALEGEAIAAAEGTASEPVAAQSTAPSEREADPFHPMPAADSYEPVADSQSDGDSAPDPSQPFRDEAEEPKEYDALEMTDLSSGIVFAPSSEDLNVSTEGESGAANDVHFTEMELSPGDSWDTDSWGAGFAPDEGVELAFHAPDEKIEEAPEPSTPDAIAEPAGVSDDAAEAERDLDEAGTIEAVIEAATNESVDPVESVDSVEARGARDPASADESHLVAYSPQPPEEEKRPRYAPR